MRRVLSSLSTVLAVTVLLLSGLPVLAATLEYTLPIFMGPFDPGPIDPNAEDQPIGTLTFSVPSGEQVVSASIGGSYR